MANNININVTTNAGAASQQIQNLTLHINSLGAASGQAGSTGRDALDGFAGGLGIPTTIAAATSAIAAGIVAVGVASVQASNQAANAARILKSDAQEAGVAFDQARINARKFGADLALSNTEAEATYAKLLRVLKAGGELNNSDKITKNIENLLAAYSIAGNETEVLFNQILSGQDEALNRLGLADPSKIYEKYAANIGKSVDALSQEEKVRSILLELSAKGERFAGAAEERLASAPGQWQQLSASISNATTALGDYLQKQTLVGTLPFLVNQLIDPKKSILNVLSDYEIKLAEDYLRQTVAAREKAIADSNAYFKRQNESLGVPEALRNPFGSFQNRVTLLGSQAAENERNNFIAQYTALFKDKRLDKVTALFAEKQFQEIRGIFSAEKATQIEQDFTKFWDKYAKVALKSLQTARDGAEKFYSSVAERGEGKDNPFVKTILEADEASKQLTRTFGIMGDATVKALQKIEDKLTRQKILNLELDAQLKANALRREASGLASFTGLSGREERLLGEFDARIKAATDAPGFEAIADAIREGRVKFETEGEGLKAKRVARGLDINEDEVSRKAIDNLRKLQNFGIKEGATFGDRANEALNEAFRNLFNSLSDEMKTRIASGAEGQTIAQTFIKAFKGGADALGRRIEEEIAKQAVVDKTIAGVREDIATIESLRRQGLDTSAADARLLATTGALESKELPADIRQARIETLRREADRQVSLQSEAIKATQEQKASTDTLTKAIDNLAGELRKPENRKLLIEFSNKSKVSDIRTELYGSLVQDD